MSRRLAIPATVLFVSGFLGLGGNPIRTYAAGGCVSPGGAGGCSSTIQAAIDAAAAGSTISVAAGAYTENITITKPLTLQGAGETLTTLNAVATNATEAIIVKGVTSGPVTISGFTIQNAALSGIKVADSSNVTITANTIQNNDKNLKFDQKTGQGSCAGAAPFDQDDCGEGLHLVGVTNSQITNNSLVGNAGGILLTDESGPTSGNTISGNTVKDNILDCGITLASHPASIGPPTTPGGPPNFVPGHQIFNNTITNNIVDHNGAAGVGLFASVPGTATFNNLVEGNTITNNGLPGVTMHSHAPGQNLNGNKIINNTLSGNGVGASLLGVDPGDADAGDTVTTGILVMSAVIPVHGTVITGNTISNETIGIWTANTVGTVLAGNTIAATTPYYEVAASALPGRNGPVPASAIVAGMAGAQNGGKSAASFTVTFTSKTAGQGFVLFGAGSGCAGLVQFGTRDSGAGTTSHSVMVTGNDLAGTIGNVGIAPGLTYSYEVITLGAGGAQVDDNGGKCYSVTIPTS